MVVGRLLAIPFIQLGHLVAEGWAAYRGESPYAEVPPLDRSWRLVGEALLDRSFSLGINVLTGVPRPGEVRQMLEDLENAHEFLAAGGWLSDPAGFHGDPPPVASFDLEPAIAWGTGGRTRYAHLRFESGFAPHPGAPGALRWQAFEENRTVHAWVLEHAGPPRPWIVCVHGFGMGTPAVDFAAFDVHRLHEKLGLNVVMPCLPLHGPRTGARFSGGEILAPDYLNMIHLFSQAAWDIRRVVSWARGRGGAHVGLYGVSLGGYNSALVAGLESGLACVIVGIPAVDFPSLARDNEPWVMRRYYDDQFDVDWQLVRTVTHVVSPLALAPQVPRERRFIFAGIADRVVRPDQARALWRHWERPAIHWFSGGHVVGQLKSDNGDFVEQSLREAGMVAAA